MRPGGGGGRSGPGVILAVIILAVIIGLAIGWMLQPKVDDSSGKPDAPIEWNAVQGAPTRVPDAEDVAWERRSGDPDVVASRSEAIQPGLPRASGARNDEGGIVSGQQIRVIDGDTFDINGERVRVAGIDAPETHPARCPREEALGLAATAKLAELLKGRPLWISGNKADRYGRSVRTVRVGGEDVADAMIGSGLARNYHGEKRQAWC